MENNGIEWIKLGQGAFCINRINGGNRKLGGKWRKQEKMGKCVTGNLKKRMSRAFATCANKPKVSFEQSKSCKMKKNGKFSEQM